MFSIITPTYNRAHTLNRVYQSLLNQTFKEFHWIIIDDCSTDNTTELVNHWINEDKIDIHYNRLSMNQGKAIAVNVGLEKCHEFITIIADSDDSFKSTTLEELRLIWNTIELTNTNPIVASVWTLTTNEDENFVGDKFPKDFWQVGFKERVLKHKIAGEKWASWRTSVLKETKMYAQPKVYIGEGFTWNRINRNYDFVCLNISHRTYYNSSDGIMATKLTKHENARRKFYNSYYGLYDTKITSLIRYSYYWDLMFEHVSSKFYFIDTDFNLGLKKNIVSNIFFFLKLPGRLLMKIT